MQAHPLYRDVAQACETYPDQAGALWQAYLDLKLSQRWDDVEIKDLSDAGCCVIAGRNPKQQTSDKTIVYPLSLALGTSISSLKIPFRYLHPPPMHILLAISSEDSSIVYYKLANGIVAPKELKD